MGKKDKLKRRLAKIRDEELLTPKRDINSFNDEIIYMIYIYLTSRIINVFQYIFHSLKSSENKLL